MVWACFSFIRSGQNHLARQSEKGEEDRQNKRWEDNIRQWTGLEFATFRMAAEKREKWKKLVVKTSVVPQWPPRLRESTFTNRLAWAYLSDSLSESKKSPMAVLKGNTWYYTHSIVTPSLTNSGQVTQFETGDYSSWSYSRQSRRPRWNSCSLQSWRGQGRVGRVDYRVLRPALKCLSKMYRQQMVILEMVNQ